MSKYSSNEKLPTQSYFDVLKNVRLNSTHYLFMKVSNKRELQQIVFNHLSDIDFKISLNLYKKMYCKTVFFVSYSCYSWIRYSFTFRKRSCRKNIKSDKITLHENKNFCLTKICEKDRKDHIFISFCMFPFHGNIIFSELFFKRKCKKAVSFCKCVPLRKYEIFVYDSCV